MFTKDDIHHVFQPIFSPKQQKTVGFEALIRHHVFDQVHHLFRTAREQNMLFLLDTRSIEKAVETFDFKNDWYLFINIFPTTITHTDFPDFLENMMDKYSIQPNRIVFELNESSSEESLWNEPMMKERITWLRQFGFLIGLDDIGSGAASIKNVIETNPDIIKLDRYFSAQLSKSTIKQEMIASFLTFCHNQHSMLVLEGVENQEDFFVASQLDIPLLQGYYIGEPIRYR